jgi:predicted ATPase
LNEELKQGQDVLDKPAKQQQKYLDDLKAWEKKKNEIEGSIESEDTLKYLQGYLSYLNEKLIPELIVRTTERKQLVESLYSKKLSLLEIRRELFQPVMQFINEFKELKERYDVKIDVALELRSFVDNFFTYVNQGRTGTFCGKEEGYKKLLDIIDKTHFNTSEEFIKFTEEIVDNLKYDRRSAEGFPVDINSQLRKGIELNELYDYINDAEFLQPVYNLKLGNKTLQELSPGERGALLLIFYLILDNDDIPLIIDQPEENLDNESVYHILVHFIKKVKEKRQIIIVTHNPNLAIVCDADQIINMQIEKENKNRVKFQSGAIEDEVMNKAIINILEGTLPAFNNRDSKYIR